MTSQKPLNIRQKIIVWTGVLFALGLACIGGLGLITDGLGGRRALSDGTVGTFTPIHRECEDSCTWVGTFTSTDGSVTAEDVKLNDAVTVRRGDPMPISIDDVRLEEEATRPAAYTADYNWHVPVIKGVVLGLVLPLLAVFCFMLVKRQRSRAVSKSR
ncbi:hypothetical protein FE633_07390 [Streptomyces montanus]|uniref:DUF3592 domain-containing protein n=1 Tax=Streptomyces montanus TaxID=2580423 RepID=A0A5R9G1N0_9ACTN|nr:hypothetical protein [Streptomyces montanus]TLS46903.1 hypothetical protein FE633_07390 [Streptomyces montanus]